MNLAKILIGIVIAGSLVGCGDSKEYDVSGELSSSTAVDEAILVEFFEIDGADASAEPESILAVTVDALGPIAEKVEADPELTILARAIVDSDDDGACTEGELWGEVELVKNDDDTVQAFAIDLKADPCPGAASAE